MSKRTEDYVLDGSLERAQQADEQVLCSAEPANFVEASSTFALARIGMTSGHFTIADGDTDGRKVTIAARAGADVEVSGIGTHIALIDTVNSRLLLVTVCEDRLVNAGRTVNFPSWKATIRDPT